MKPIQQTDDFLIEEIQRMYNLLGRAPIGYTEYKYRQKAINRFGSWENALQLAGVNGATISDEGLEIRARYIHEAKEIYRILGRAPKKTDFDDYRMVRYYFGTLGKLCEAAGMKRKNNSWVATENTL
ncbi:homing endonuclease associated repeat-containing protein [Listeria booriae]|uniref:homing endonuclease associated repeat-containing protein n=1 Tax=Listeria booriae TaxID=1552123 RepID=UPI0016291449|nr:hypothetical protein [Listeria booriae]MBC2173875.1 hypothetical protein [Listeria booriae]